MSWSVAVEHAAQAQGLDLIAVERSGGLLRVTIDWPWVPGDPERFISAEDCEKLTRQLQYLLEVEGVEYARLEVSSPGIDRPLRNEQDFLRFEGEVVDITLKGAIGSSGQSEAGVSVAASRRKFRGRCIRQSAGRWILACEEPPIGTPLPRGKQKVKVESYALEFCMEDLKEARLAPLVNFKGRAPRPASPKAAAEPTDAEKN